MQPASYTGDRMSVWTSASATIADLIAWLISSPPGRPRLHHCGPGQHTSALLRACRRSGYGLPRLGGLAICAGASGCPANDSGFWVVNRFAKFLCDSPSTADLGGTILGVTALVLIHPYVPWPGFSCPVCSDRRQMNKPVKKPDEVRRVFLQCGKRGYTMKTNLSGHRYLRSARCLRSGGPGPVSASSEITHLSRPSLCRSCAGDLGGTPPGRLSPPRAHSCPAGCGALATL
jgi:hypothetical protein